MLFWNRWNEESAGRVYFNILRKNKLTPQPHVQPLSCNLEWTSRKLSRKHLLKRIRDNLALGSPRVPQSLTPELLISLLYMRRRGLGRDRIVRRTWRGRRRTSELNQLMPLDNNLMREGNDAENSRLDVSGIGVWGPFDRTFLDITVWTRMRHDKGIDQV